MNRTQETRKTGLQPQRFERLALAIARPTFDLAYARERWRAAQRLLDAEGFALYPESILEAAQLDSLFASHPQALFLPSFAHPGYGSGGTRLVGRSAAMKLKTA